MGWSEPRDWTVGEIVTETMMDTHLKNNLRYLKGEDGVVTLQSGLILDNSLGTEYFKIPPLTTAQMATALATTSGRIAYDETIHRIKFYDGSGIRAVVSSADVHDTPVNGSTQNPVSSNWAFDYANIVTATGDMKYATGTGVETRLGIGTALQLLRTNAGATAPQWWTSSGAVIASGNYTGNSAVNRAIAHGLGVTPKLIVLKITNDSYWYIIFGAVAMIGSLTAGALAQLAVTIPDNTNFYVGNATNYSLSANLDTYVYYWVAIG